MTATNTLTAIDSDGHILEHRADIVRYLEPPFAGRRTPIWPGGQPWDLSEGDRISSPKSAFMPRVGYVENMSAAEQVALWHKILDENNIEKAVLFPTGSGNVAKLQEGEFAIAVCRACNKHFANDYADDRLKPMGVLPMRNPIAAADELRRGVNEFGLVGFEILTDGLPLALGNTFYDPVYKAAEETGATLGVHGTRHWSHEFSADRLSTFSEVHCFVFPAGIMLHFTSVIAQGLPARFPNLRLGFLETGATWLPFYLDRLDEHWERRGHVDMPRLSQRPSDTFRASSLKVSTEGGETLLAETADYVGDEHIIFATDIPHWDSEFPDNLREFRENTTLSEKSKKRILYDNAKELFGL